MLGYLPDLLVSGFPGTIPLLSVPQRAAAYSPVCQCQIGVLANGHCGWCSNQVST